MVMESSNRSHRIPEGIRVRIAGTCEKRIGDSVRRAHDVRCPCFPSTRSEILRRNLENTAGRLNLSRHYRSMQKFREGRVKTRADSREVELLHRTPRLPPRSVDRMACQIEKYQLAALERIIRRRGAAQRGVVDGSCITVAYRMKIEWTSERTDGRTLGQTNEATSAQPNKRLREL